MFVRLVKVSFRVCLEWTHTAPCGRWGKNIQQLPVLTNCSHSGCFHPIGHKSLFDTILAPKRVEEDAQKFIFCLLKSYEEYHLSRFPLQKLNIT